MSRNLDPALQVALGGGVISPLVLVMLTFRSQTQYVWSGIGTLLYEGNSYLGIGSLGKVGTISEGVDIKADGMTLSLSGIDPVFRSACMTDIQVGAPAKVWFGLWANGGIIGTPYLIYSGSVDKPTITIGSDSITVQLALENKMLDLQRPSNRRYTAADQHLYYPDDTAFLWVEKCNDIALIWGS